MALAREVTVLNYGDHAMKGAVALARVSELKLQSCVNMVLALFAVMFMSVNIVCTILNGYDNEDPQSAATSPYTFHLLEFWGTFVFNLVAVFALMYSPKRLSSIVFSPFFLKLTIFVNVAGSFTAALLVTINIEKFEVASHEIEYTNELTMAFIDLILLASLLRGMYKKKVEDRSNIVASVGAVGLAVFVAAIQLYVYNGLGWTEDGEPKGEQKAHYLEFFVELISAGITFWFTIDNKLLADAKMKQILLAVQNLKACDACDDDDDDDACELLETETAAEDASAKTNNTNIVDAVV